MILLKREKERKESSLKKNTEPIITRLGKIMFVMLAIIFACCIAIQVFLAGLAFFVNPVNWAKHSSFVHLFQLIPIFMFVIAIVGRMPRWAVWQSAGLIGFIYSMYITAHINVILPWAAAIHPVIAMVIFWMSIVIVSKAWREVFQSKLVKE
jgi:hypothetical protein